MQGERDWLKKENVGQNLFPLDCVGDPDSNTPANPLHAPTTC